MSACPHCGHVLREPAKFCPECGGRLADAAPPREERKVVTVLFCDLVGSTAQAERLDPEDVRALLSAYHERVRTELERFGGTVEKFIGDAVMAVFGAPVAHEDDPERAVRAALAVRDAALEPDSGLEVRIAVHTGEALVALGARPSEGEAMVAGDVVNTAARLQSAAPVNGILVGEHTYRATERAIEYREHDAVPAKGKSEPVRTWEVVAARSRFGVDVAQGSRRPLVGRADELDVLLTAFRRAEAERTPQLVTLVGVPGIGKSRLLGELFAELDRGDRLVTWRQGRSLPYGEGVSYWALGEMLKAQAGILESDEPEAVTAKIDEAVARLLQDEAERAWVGRHLRPLVGLAPEDEGGGDRRGEAFAAWRRFLEALGEQRPAVLVFEDLHWADDGLLDFVDHVADWLTDVPVLVVASARPELLARRPAWGGGKANASTVSLAPLSDDETATLVHTLLERSVLPAELQTALLERAGGNPLYAEEFARMVEERGTVGLELPESVQGIIAARLDGLDPEDKRLVQDAAVVGKVFWSGAVAALGERDRFAVEERLHALERRELVRRERRSSIEGESEYAFRHVLVRDVAYGAIPRAERAERHRRAAEWIESLGRPDDHAEPLAFHYRSALALAREAGTDSQVLAGPAAIALVRAGDRAYALNGFVQSAAYYAEALELGVADEARPRVLSRLAQSYGFAADERAVEAFERAIAAHLDVGNTDAAGEDSASLADVLWHRGDAPAARRALERAGELVGRSRPTRSAARVLAQRARHAMLAGSPDAIAIAQEGLALAEAHGYDELVPDILNSLGVARAHAGDDRGLDDLRRSIELGLAANDVGVARAYNNLGSIAWARGELRESDRLYREGLDAAIRLGNEKVRRFISSQLFWRDFDAGDWDEALAVVDAFIAECEAGSPHYNEGSAHEARALILLYRDRIDEALAETARALELAREIGDPQSVAPALSTLIAVYAERGRLDEARTAAEELVELQLVPSSAMSSSRSLAEWCEELGTREFMLAQISEGPSTPWNDAISTLLGGDLLGAAERLEELGDRSFAARLRLRAAEELAASGRLADARVPLQQALVSFERAGATRLIRRAEGLLAKSA